MSVKAKAILCLFVFLISVVGCSREAEVSEKQTVPYSQSVTFKETEAKKETTTENRSNVRAFRYREPNPLPKRANLS